MKILICITELNIFQSILIMYYSLYVQVHLNKLEYREKVYFFL